jgi:hypothetical protein
LRRRLASAECFRESAMARGLPDLKMDCCRSSASLCAITEADHRLPVVLAPRLVPRSAPRLVPACLAPACLAPARLVPACLAPARLAADRLPAPRCAPVRFEPVFVAAARVFAARVFLAAARACVGWRARVPLPLLPTLLLLVAIMRNASSTIRAARALAAVTRFQRLNHLALTVEPSRLTRDPSCLTLERLVPA